MLRNLIGAASIAIIAAVAYFFWTEYREYAAEKARREKIDRVQRELFQFADATDGDRTKVTAYCEALHASIGEGGNANAVSRQLDINCRALGYR